MRVVLASEVYPPRAGGAGWSAHALALGLRQAGHDVSVITTSLGSESLDGIPSLGPKRRKELLTRFGSVEGVRSAPFEDLAAVPGVGERLARTIRERLGAEGAGL